MFCVITGLKRGNGGVLQNILVKFTQSENLIPVLLEGDATEQRATLHLLYSTRLEVCVEFNRVSLVLSSFFVHRLIVISVLDP